MASTEQTPIEPNGNARPGPLAAFVEGHAMPDGSRIVMLRLEHAAGSTLVGFDGEFGQQLAKQIAEQSTGITIPTALDSLKIARG